MNTNSNLRKRTSHVEEKWTLENLRAGLDYFFEINNRYPTVKEVDSFEYLPTSRTIQRSFNGLMELRKTLGLDTPINHSKGITRSKTAQDADKRAQIYEKEFYDYLISKIPEVKVHEHKIIRPGNTASDFFIYTSDTKGIVIDVFYAVDIYSLCNVVNIKFKKYVNVEFPVYFVLVGNDKITQELIDQKIDNRKNKLSNHICVLTEESFKNSLNKLLIS